MDAAGLLIFPGFLDAHVHCASTPFEGVPAATTKFRYSGTGISYSVSAILGGMIAPSVLAGLIGQDALRNWHYVPLVYGIYCVVAMVALAFIRETRDLRMEELDQQAEPGRVAKMPA